MSDIIKFENEEFGTIRSVVIDGEPWFVAADVCKALEIANPTDALRRLDTDERTLVSIEGSSNGLPVNAVNEPGLYALILGSRKPEAKPFKRWIAHEVIPSIRKDGFYLSGCGSIESQILKCVQDNIVPAVKTLEVVAPCVADLCERVNALEQKANAPQKSLEDSVVDLSGLDAKQWKEYQTRNLKMIAYSQDMRDKDVLSSMYKEIEFTNDISLRKVIEHCRGGVFAGIRNNNKFCY